jgi:hypothetical protein
VRRRDCLATEEAFGRSDARLVVEGSFLALTSNDHRSPGGTIVLP